MPKPRDQCPPRLRLLRVWPPSRELGDLPPAFLYPLITLGIARADYIIRYLNDDEIALCSDHVDRVLPDEAVHSLPPEYVRPQGAKAVRMKNCRFPPILNQHALHAFTPTSGDPPLEPATAAWLWERRTELERDRGVLTASAWCLHCGHHFLDARVTRGHLVTSIARWCHGCRMTRTRHLPALRKCEALDCIVWFKPRSANHVFCVPACKEAARSTRKTA